MLAMPISSSRPTEPPKPRAPAVLSFHSSGNSFDLITAVDSAKNEVAHFQVSNTHRGSFTISRQTNSTTPPLLTCTARKSSLSGTTTLTMHNGDVNFKLRSTVGLSYSGYAMELPMLGKLTWRTDSASEEGRGMKLVDEAGMMVAHTDLKDKRMDLFVGSDELVLDCLVAGWVALVKMKISSAEGVAAALDLIGTLAGGGGGG